MAVHREDQLPGGTLKGGERGGAEHTCTANKLRARRPLGGKKNPWGGGSKLPGKGRRVHAKKNGSRGQSPRKRKNLRTQGFVAF